MKTILRTLEVLSEAARLELRRGPIYSFVPAHGGSRAGAVAERLGRILTERTLSEVPGFSVLLAGFRMHDYSLWSPDDTPRRLDGRTWGAFVCDADGLDVLDAREVQPGQLRQVLNFAQFKYGTIFADVTGAKEPHTVDLLRSSECIFVVSGSDRNSLDMAREKYEWLRSMDMGDQCGLLLDRVPHGVTADEAEEITGLPLCSRVDREEYLQRLAGWLACEEVAAARKMHAA